MQSHVLADKDETRTASVEVDDARRVEVRWYDSEPFLIWLRLARGEMIIEEGAAGTNGTA
jgi:hypothetical protein